MAAGGEQGGGDEGNKWVEVGVGNWRKAVKRHKLPVRRETSSRDVMCNMINIIYPEER